MPSAETQWEENSAEQAPDSAARGGQTNCVKDCDVWDGRGTDEFHFGATATRHEKKKKKTQGAWNSDWSKAE